MTPDLCNAPIIGRDGKPLGFECNLPPRHLGRCASVFEGESTRLAALVSEEPETTVSRGG